MLTRFALSIVNNIGVIRTHFPLLDLALLTIMLCFVEFNEFNAMRTLIRHFYRVAVSELATFSAVLLSLISNFYTNKLLGTSYLSFNCIIYYYYSIRQYFRRYHLADDINHTSRVVLSAPNCNSQTIGFDMQYFMIVREASSRFDFRGLK